MISERSVAFKIRISDLLSSRFVKKEGLEPSHLETRFGNVSRANIIATVVGKDGNEFYKELIVDDGSGKISVRSFEQKNKFDEFGIGDFVLVIGKPREFGNEKYLVYEIVRKIDDARWLALRSMELRKSEERLGAKYAVKEVTNEVPKKSLDSAGEKGKSVIDVIKKFDFGEGADYAVVAKMFDNAEERINELIKRGDLFEPRPGKLKVLE